MLQFWRRDKQKSPLSSPSKLQNGNSQLMCIDHGNSVSIGPLSGFKHDSIIKQPCEKKSRLSLELEDVLSNKIALSYYCQFMEARGYSNILNLWLELEQVPFPSQSYSHRRVHSSSSSPLKLPAQASCSDSDKADDLSVRVMHLIRNYIADDAPYRIRVPEDSKTEIYVKCQASEFRECFNFIRDYILQAMKKEVWMDFLRSDWHCKYQVEVMTSGAMSLSDVLYNDQCLGSFMEFLEQEDLLCVIEFWLAATSFEKQFTVNQSLDPNQIQNDAIIIYDRYLSLQATSPLGINDKVRFAVEEGICGEEACSGQCLVRAVAAVEAFMKATSLRPFLSSPQYLSLLSEVMSTSRSNHSPASSVTEGSVDTRPPPDPDELWRRRKHNSGLSFGRIDQLGRYETDIEPEPKAESRISRVVKLLLNKEEQKAQEEMAWRVAEMIVKDITSITMGGNRESDEESDI